MQPLRVALNETWYYIGIRTSQDLKTWKDAGAVFKDIPAWARQAIPGTQGIWAPDISYVDGRYRLYYSISTFGSNRSAIGLATSPTLGAKAKWTDHGMVVMSTKDSDFNAIDPNFVVDAQGRHWLALGSFWTGIKLFALDKQTGKVVDGTKPYSIARRPAPAGGPAPVEAPFIIPHAGWYYLIVSYDYCCKGVNSTYYTVVGRSKDVTGPYPRQGRQRLDARRWFNSAACGFAGAAALSWAGPCRRFHRQGWHDLSGLSRLRQAGGWQADTAHRAVALGRRGLARRAVLSTLNTRYRERTT